MPNFRPAASRFAKAMLRHAGLRRWIDRRERQTYRFPPGHFYSPIPDVDQILSQSDRIFPPTPPDVPGVNLNVNEQLALLDQLAIHVADQPFAENAIPGLRYHFNNQYFRHTDGLVLHCMMRHFGPKRIIEVGSGFSSAVMLDTDERFLGRSTDLTFIEPHPQRLGQLLRPEDSGYARTIEKEVQQIPLDLFSSLQSGDVLFIDSSHVAKVGSDVNHLMFNVIPKLSPGVIVHFHDLFYPFEYPRDWIVGGMAWNEAYLLHAFLQFNDSFSMMLFNDLLGKLYRNKLQQFFPLTLTDTGGSLWLRKTK